MQNIPRFEHLRCEKMLFSVLQTVCACIWVLFWYRTEMKGTSCLLFKSISVCKVWVDGDGYWRIRWSFHGMLYVYVCMPVRSVISCMVVCLYGAFALVFEFCLWFFKKKRPQGLLLPGLIGKLIISLWVEYQWMCVCLCKIQDYLQRQCVTVGVLSCSDKTLVRRWDFSHLKGVTQPGIWAELSHWLKSK